MTERIRIPEKAWRKSSYSGSNGGECVEVAVGAVTGLVPVRDSKDSAGPALAFTHAAWSDFVSFAARQAR